MSATSLDLSQIKTDALSAASTFRTLIGLGNVDNTSDANKPISIAAQSALDAKLNLSGGTLTGGLSGTTGAFSGEIRSSDIGATSGNRISIANQLWQFSMNGSDEVSFTQQGGTDSWGVCTRLGGFAAGPLPYGDVKWVRDAANIWAQRFGANAQTLRLYGSYTDPSNYRRFYLSSTTGGQFTLGVEGAGTGASGNSLRVANSITMPNDYSNMVVGRFGSLSLPSNGRTWNFTGAWPDGLVISGSTGLNTYHLAHILMPNEGVSGAGFNLASSVGLGWYNGDPNTTHSNQVDGRIIRNDTGQLDFRADNGLRLRNLANSSWSTFQSGSITANGAGGQVINIVRAGLTSFGLGDKNGDSFRVYNNNTNTDLLVINATSRLVECGPITASGVVSQDVAAGGDVITSSVGGATKAKLVTATGSGVTRLELWSSYLGTPAMNWYAEVGSSSGYGGFVSAPGGYMESANIDPGGFQYLSSVASSNYRQWQVVAGTRQKFNRGTTLEWYNADYRTDTNSSDLAVGRDSANTFGIYTDGTKATKGNLTVGAITASGVVLLPNGSASAPAIAFSGDPDSGIYWHSANTINIGLGGLVRQQFQSDGSIQLSGSDPWVYTANWAIRSGGSGIINLRAGNGSTAAAVDCGAITASGLVTANNNLTVSNPSDHAIINISSIATRASFLSFTSDGGTHQTTFGLTGQNSQVFTNTTAGDFAIRAPANRATHFGSNNAGSNSTSAMTLTSTGNLGIGTASPGSRLDVSSSTNTLGYGDGVRVAWADNVATNRPVVGFYRSRGTLTSPTNMSSNDVIGSFSFFGRASGAFGAFATIRSTYESGAGGNLEFWTAPTAAGSSEVQRLTINRDGNVGIGQSNPNVGLVIRRSGADLPALRLEDGDITVPFTGLSINPTLNANTITNWSSVSSSSGGCSLQGFTNNTTEAYPFRLSGYHGSASPTKPAINFEAFKSDGGSSSTILASSELIAGFYNGLVTGTPVVTIAASGAITASGIATINGGNQNAAGIQLSGSTVFGPYGLSNGWTFVQASAAQMRFSGGGIVIQSGKTFAWGNAFTDTGTTQLWEDASHVVAQRNGANAQTWRVYNTFTDTSNYIRQSLSFTTYSGTVYAQHIAEGAGTGAVNIPLVLTPRGTGAFIVGPMPDGTTTGGNARGAYAVDLQLDRGAANQVASGDYSFIVASKRARATGDCSVVFASNTTNSVVVSGKNSVAFAQGDSGGASGTCAVAFGDFGGYGGAFASGFSSLGACGGRASNTYAKAFGGGTSASRFGQTSFANGYFANLADSQYSIFVARNKTTNNTTTTLFLNGSSERITIPSGSLFLFTAKIVGVRSDGLQRASYIRKGTIINVAGTTSLVGVIEAVGTDVEDNPALDMTITADDANDALAITVTGITGETWRWVAVVEGVEVAYGT